MPSLNRNMAALSPYNLPSLQPQPLRFSRVSRAVYLTRHGIIEVSRHDFEGAMVSFLKKLKLLQKKRETTGLTFASGQLSFLEVYQTWITSDHVGMVSSDGLDQSAQLGLAFRKRYRHWLDSNQGSDSISNDRLKTTICWSDAAARCRFSATTFADAFSGTSRKFAASDNLSAVNCVVKVLDSPKRRSQSSNNLAWHIAFDVDQTAGQKEMDEILEVVTSSARARLRPHWTSPVELTPNDVYAMQLLHCYDILAGHDSPFTHLFTEADWAGFEYVRDVKYHFSEGYGSRRPGFFAIPWFVAAFKVVTAECSEESSLPLSLAFTHREEILYLCCLLGIGHDHDWRPDLTRIDEKRKWRSSVLSPYLSHVGLEKYQDSHGDDRIRVILNGAVEPAFFNAMEPDLDGGYKVDELKEWTQDKVDKWSEYSKAEVNFL